MVDKIKKLIDESGMTPSAFANFIGINPATMIQTLKRNNQVSTNVIIPILDKYPRLNPEWLLLGKEPMYKDEKTVILHPPVNPGRKEPDIFDNNDEAPVANTPGIESPKQADNQTESQKIMPDLSLSENIDKIVIFFKNKTFVTLKPED
jgi:hypothetical protein